MTTAVLSEHATVIAKTNDTFRQTGFGIHLTIGVQHLENLMGLLQAVRQFNAFCEDNDPYGEHDFGSIEWNGVTVFWKIDYYNQSMTAGISPLASSCQRVLTVMRADEY